MQLSNRASKYLTRLHRDLNFTCSQELTLSYLKKNGLPAFESVINYQTYISGFMLSVEEKSSESFSASLFTINDIKAGTPIETVQTNNKHYFFCGDFATAQFNIVLSEDGEICTYDEKEDTVNPIYSSGELLIENLALMDYLSKDAVELLPYYDINDNEHLEKEMARHGHFSRANDKYNTWYIADNVVVHKGVWFDRPEFYIHIYGKTINKAKDFCSLLQMREIIR